MKYSHSLLFTALVVTAISCSKPDSTPTPTPTPVEEDLTTPVAGIYKLTSVTPVSSTLTIAGVGSMTVVAIDKITTKVTQVRSFTNTATGAHTLFTNTDELTKVGKDGQNLVFKTPAGTIWATVTGNKISTNDVISPSLTTAVTLTTQYTKQ